MCILTYRSPYRVAEKKAGVGGRERPPHAGRPAKCGGSGLSGLWSGHWGSRKLALHLFGHRLGCPVVHICNLNFSTSLLGIPVSASELFISAFISHILHCGPTVDLDPQSRADLSNLFHSNNSHTINHPLAHRSSSSPALVAVWPLVLSSSGRSSVFSPLSTVARSSLSRVDAPNALF